MNDNLIHYDPQTRELFCHVANHPGKVDLDELSRRSSSISVYDLNIK
ncbi:MAG: hypothetical protein KBA26_00305 [Candidatus Delongbacteria bacterium]|nr:hypothetical protein [Candidatus Delongbacteria bacterium]